jgi:hypothetical protein
MDGPKVNTGSKTGVVKQLRDQPEMFHLIGIHYLAHRLELTLGDVAKEVPLQKQVDALFLQLYLFYHKSTLNRSNLKCSYAALGMKFLVPTRVGGTRWAPHTSRALYHILRGYAAIIQHLQEV